MAKKSDIEKVLYFFAKIGAAYVLYDSIVTTYERRRLRALKLKQPTKISESPK